MRSRKLDRSRIVWWSVGAGGRIRWGISALVGAALLGGCTPNRVFFTTSNPVFFEDPKHRDPEPNLQWPQNQELLPGPSPWGTRSQPCSEAKRNKDACGDYYLAIVEFDDQGQLREPAQLADAKRMVSEVRKKLEHNLASGSGRDSLTLVFYTHGWKHYPNLSQCRLSPVGGAASADAAQLPRAGNGGAAGTDKEKRPKCRSDLERFRFFLQDLSQKDTSDDSPPSGASPSSDYERSRQNLQRSHVVGIFLTWRGVPLRRMGGFERAVSLIPNQLSFFTRSRAAGRIGGQGASYLDAIYELSSLARKAVQAPCAAAPQAAKDPAEMGTEGVEEASRCEAIYQAAQSGSRSPGGVAKGQANASANGVARLQGEKHFGELADCSEGQMWVRPRTTVVALGHSLGAKITELAVGQSLIAGTKVRSAASESARVQIEVSKTQAERLERSAHLEWTKAIDAARVWSELDLAVQARQTDLDEYVAQQEASLGESPASAKATATVNRNEVEQDLLKARENLRELKEKLAELLDQRQILRTKIQRFSKRFIEKLSALETKLRQVGTIPSSATKLDTSRCGLEITVDCAGELWSTLLRDVKSRALAGYLTGRKPDISVAEPTPSGTTTTGQSHEQLIAGEAQIDVFKVQALKSISEDALLLREHIRKTGDKLDSNDEQERDSKGRLADKRTQIAELQREKRNIEQTLKSIEDWQRSQTAVKEAEGKRDALEASCRQHSEARLEFLEEEAKAREKASVETHKVVSIPFDIVLLINPAAPALRTMELRTALDALPDWMKRETGTHKDGKVAKPLLISISSDRDRVTRDLYRWGQKLGLSLRPFFTGRKHAENLTVAAPHRKDLLTHGICAADNPKPCEGCQPCDKGKPLFKDGDRSYHLRKARDGSKIGPYWIIDEGADLIGRHADALTPEMKNMLIALLATARAFEPPPAKLNGSTSEPGGASTSAMAEGPQGGAETAPQLSEAPFTSAEGGPR